MLKLIFDKEDKTFRIFFGYAHLEKTSGDNIMRLPSDLLLIYCIVSQSSMPIIKYEHFQISSGARASLHLRY